MQFLLHPNKQVLAQKHTPPHPDPPALPDGPDMPEAPGPLHPLDDTVTSEEEDLQDDEDSTSSSDNNEIPDSRVTDLTWVAPKHKAAPNARPRVVTRARGK